MASQSTYAPAFGYAPTSKPQKTTMIFNTTLQKELTALKQKLLVRIFQQQKKTSTPMKPIRIATDRYMAPVPVVEDVKRIYELLITAREQLYMMNATDTDAAAKGIEHYTRYMHTEIRTLAELILKQHEYSAKNDGESQQIQNFEGLGVSDLCERVRSVSNYGQTLKYSWTGPHLLSRVIMDFLREKLFEAPVCPITKDIDLVLADILPEVIKPKPFKAGLYERSLRMELYQGFYQCPKAEDAKQKVSAELTDELYSLLGPFIEYEKRDSGISREREDSITKKIRAVVNIAIKLNEVLQCSIHMENFTPTTWKLATDNDGNEIEYAPVNFLQKFHKNWTIYDVVTGTEIDDYNLDEMTSKDIKVHFLFMGLPGLFQIVRAQDLLVPADDDDESVPLSGADIKRLMERHAEQNATLAKARQIDDDLGRVAWTVQVYPREVFVEFSHSRIPEETGIAPRVNFLADFLNLSDSK